MELLASIASALGILDRVSKIVRAARRWRRRRKPEPAYMLTAENVRLPDSPLGRY